MAAMLRKLLGCVWLTAASGVAFAPVAIAADPVEAVEGAKDGGASQQTIVDPNLLNYVVAIVVFVGAILILRKIAWPLIIKGLDDRERKILGEIENAERARAEAEEAQRQYAAELAKARGEAQQMIEDAKAEATRTAAALKAENEAEINAMRDSARQQIAAAQRAAVAEVYSEAGRVATAIAAKILQREVNEHDQQRLIDETLSEITNEYAEQRA